MIIRHIEHRAHTTSGQAMQMRPETNSEKTKTLNSIVPISFVSMTSVIVNEQVLYCRQNIEH